MKQELPVLPRIFIDNHFYPVLFIEDQLSSVTDPGVTPSSSSMSFGDAKLKPVRRIPWPVRAYPPAYRA